MSLEALFFSEIVFVLPLLFCSRLSGMVDRVSGLGTSAKNLTASEVVGPTPTAALCTYQTQLVALEGEGTRDEFEVRLDC